MPLYEFYCEPCHTVFTFRSTRVDTVTVPSCPTCGARLAREVSAFSHSLRGTRCAEPGGEGAAAERMEQVMARMGERIQTLDDEDADPREAVRAMREMASAGGLQFNSEVCEAMARIEAGEDPEKIDEAFSEVFESEHPFANGEGEAGAKRADEWRRMWGPRRDPAWHDLSEQKGGEK